MAMDGPPPIVTTDDREQMCLETYFQYEFSTSGHFGQLELQRKKIQIVISMQL